MSGLRTQAALLKRPPAYRKSCAAESCCETIEPNRIFCRNHWFFLPERLRARILRTFFRADWERHQDAVRQGADLIDAAVIEGGAISALMFDGEGGAGVPVRWQSGRML
jgi:hypothetical protein